MTRDAAEQFCLLQVAQFEQMKRTIDLSPPSEKRPESWNDAEENRAAWFTVWELIHTRIENESFDLETLENLHQKQMQTED